MTDENKPKEIDALTLDKFNLMVDNVLVKLEESKGFKKTETVKEEITVLKEEKINPEGNGLAELTITGNSIGDMMVSLFNEETNQYISLYSNATICAKIIGLNPTTIRQRASGNKVINGVKWGYMTSEVYNNLIK
jgi:hypothetical protein